MHLNQVTEAGRKGGEQVAVYINGVLYTRENYIDQKTLAQFLGVSTKTVEGWRLYGKGPRYRRVGDKLIRYQVGDALDFAEAQVIEPMV